MVVVCEMEKIKMIAENHNLKIIEDCAHAIESEHQGKKQELLAIFLVLVSILLKI